MAEILIYRFHDPADNFFQNTLRRIRKPLAWEIIVNDGELAELTDEFEALCKKIDIETGMSHFVTNSKLRPLLNVPQKHKS